MAHVYNFFIGMQCFEKKYSEHKNVDVSRKHAFPTSGVRHDAIMFWNTSLTDESRV